MDFSEALQALKAGKMATRRLWNGPGQYVLLAPARTVPFGASGAAQVGLKDAIPIGAHFLILTVQRHWSAWTPNTEDLLAEDWQTSTNPHPVGSVAPPDL